MTVPIDVGHEFSRLRSFQRDTANYAFDRLFGHGPESGSRFLVADEVGLGKTMVARGVIAKVIDHLQYAGDDRVDIVYICSNGAIAAQNLRKLAPTGVHVELRTERLPLLAFRLSAREHARVNLIALTPGTSFTKGWSTGQVEERAAVLRALQQLWGGRRLLGAGIGRIFAAGIGRGYYHASKEERIRALASATGNLSDEALHRFGKEIAQRDAARAARGLPDLDTSLHNLAPRFARPDDPSSFAIQERNALISELREALAMTGAHLLQPDLVVLDEFQRFRDVIHNRTSDYAGEIANQLFDYHHERFDRRTRVLMLSATPYVMHTTSAEAAAGGDRHYADFLETYRFLADGLRDTDADSATVELRADLSALRMALVAVPTDGPGPARAAAAAVSERLRKVMVRTERLAATPDRGGMLHTVDDSLPVPTTTALEQYLSTARVAQYVGEHTKASAHDVIEYWKSAPYTLSYLGAHGYQLADALRALAGPDADEPDTRLLAMLQKSPAVLPWDRMRDYQRVDAAHAGLARLWEDFFDDAQAHRLLWMPPSLPYYSAGGDFETDAARRLTKRLIFSSWTLVPTAIATLTSYEAERRLHDAATGAGAVTHRYDDERRAAPRLRFAAETQSMAHLQFVIPSPTLARLSDPLAEAVRVRSGGGIPTWEGLLDDVTDRISAAIAPVAADIPEGRAAGSTSWYTLAPLLLDESRHSIQVLRDDEEGSTALDRHLTELERLRLLARSDRPDDRAQLPPRPPDLARVLAMRSLAGPPSVLFRAFARLFPDADEAQLVGAAANAAEGFRTLFNSAEAIQVIDAFGEGEVEYWQRVLHYCGRGNLQAVVDEFVAVLVENRGYDRALDRSEALSDVASDVRKTLGLWALYRPAAVTFGGDGDDPRWQQLRVRGRFALRYGSASTEERAEQRSADVSLAFNSPFWPFILASTSVGQEGLDFHPYSHAVSHWNLPGNPVDLEQREGRIHRYKGHAVRKNVASAMPFPDGEGPPWQQLFDAAARHKDSLGSDMIPFWVFAPEELAGEEALIERHLPITPFTREKSVIGSLLSSVVHYRLAFGQPRQDELVEAFAGLPDDVLKELGTIRVDLSPPPSSPRPSSSSLSRSTSRPKARPDARDWTLYVITTPTGETQPLRKRRAVLEMVLAVSAAGVNGHTIQAAIPGSEFLRVDGDVDGEELRAAFVSAYPNAGGNERRWFLDSPIHQQGSTWVLSKMWGLNTEPTLSALAALAPGHGFRPDTA